MRDIDILLTNEMNNEEWTKFRRQWMETYVKELAVECDTDTIDAEEMADIRFEDYVGQEGYSMRDEEICAKRSAQADTHEHFAG